jgi:hypothetical protein
MGSEVFINYRGEDSRSYGALLYVELSRCFGSELVFLDSESIPAGADFVEQLLGRVRRARVMLAVVGPGWLAAGQRWRPWVKEPADWTRLELVEAFTAGVTVIPVLTDDAEMPTERELPGSLAALSRCQYRRLRHRDAVADLDRILGDLIAFDPQLALAARRRSAATLRPAPASRLDRWRRELDRWNGAVNPSLATPPARPAPGALSGLTANPSAPTAHLDRYRTLVAGRRRGWPPRDTSALE